MLICPKCGYDNHLGLVFCHACGEKLNLENIKPPTPVEKKRQQLQRGTKRTVKTILDIAIAVVLILGVVLICLTPSVAPVQPTDDELSASGAKRADLEKLVNDHKSGQVVVTESELNTFFSKKPFDKPNGQGIEMTTVALRTSLSDGCVKVEFLGTAHFGAIFDKNLYLGYAGQPSVAGGQFVFKPTGAWLGRLPIHPIILRAMPFIGSRLGRLFGGLNDEKALLDKLTSIDVTKESAAFVMSAAPAH